MHPFRGLTFERGYHWVWLLLVLLSVPILLACLVCIGPGWFLGALWLGFIAEAMPEEVQEANKQHHLAKGSYPALQVVPKERMTPLDWYSYEQRRYYP